MKQVRFKNLIGTSTEHIMRYNKKFKHIVIQAMFLIQNHSFHNVQLY